MSQGPTDTGDYGNQQAEYGAGGPGDQGVSSGSGGREQLPSTEDERLWAMLAHIGSVIVPLVAPLVVLLTKGKDSAFVKHHAEESLNFTITVIIAMTVSMILIVVAIGLLTTPAIMVGAYVFWIIAGIKAYSGESYRYPVSIRLVK